MFNKLLMVGDIKILIFSPNFGVAMHSHQEGAGAVSLLSGGRRELAAEDLCRRRRTSWSTMLSCWNCPLQIEHWSQNLKSWIGKGVNSVKMNNNIMLLMTLPDTVALTIAVVTVVTNSCVLSMLDWQFFYKSETIIKQYLAIKGFYPPLSKW